MIRKSENIKNGDENSNELSKLHQDLEKIEQADNTKKQTDFENLDHESQKFINEFNKLKIYSDKLKNWRNKFWEKGHFGIDTLTALHGLVNILPENDEERTLLNKERMALLIQVFGKPGSPKALIYKNINFEELRKNYLKNIQSVIIKKKYIEIEIVNINKEVEDIEKLRLKRINMYPNQRIKDNIFHHSFQLSYNHGLEPNLGERIFSRDELTEIITGISAGKYLRFLQDQLLKYNQKPESQITEKLWNGDIDSLKLLRELLLRVGWIAEIREEDFINHFTNKPSDRSINWLVEEISFIALFDKLAFAINPTFLKSWDKYKNPSPTELSKHFVFKGIRKTSKQLTQIRSIIDKSNNNKPKYLKREETIDIIINKIKEEF